MRAEARSSAASSPSPTAFYRWGVGQSLLPVAFFLLSIPLAIVSTTLAVVFWLLAVPFALFSRRWEPEDAHRYF